jgi:antitoxin (DNA-binding transcriptional repressor) of toxin-antitoxin stability system
MTTTPASTAGPGEPGNRRISHRSDRDRFDGFLAVSHLSGTVVVGGDVPVLLRTDRQEIEAPRGSGLLEYLIDRVRLGGRVYLTRDGQRVAGVVPADVAESIDPEEDGPVASRRRTLDELRWEQGVEPVEDPAELQGEVLGEAEFAEFFAAVMSARLP